VLNDEDVVVGMSALLSLLVDPDSFVYLGVLRAIAALGDVSRKQVFSALLTAFSDDEAGARYRSLVGEALAHVLRRAGAAAPPLVPALVGACVVLARTRPSTEDAARLDDGAVNLSTMHVAPAVLDDDDDDDGGGAAVKTEAAAAAADRAVLRQSALSLLAEAAVSAGWAASALSTRLLDVLDVATGVLAMETAASQAATASRRSAAFVLRHLVAGLGEKLVHMDGGGTYLRQAYRALKQSAETDRDHVVRFHSLAALGALDDVMRQQLFWSDAHLRGEHVPKFGIHR
jgi:hypothetical protein